MTNKLMNKKELAAYLGVSVKTIDRWVHINEIPYFKLNGTLVRFKTDAIENWLSEQEH